MKIQSKKSSERKLIPAGLYAGRCIWVVDMGTQPGGKYDPRAQVVIAFEFADQTVEVEGEEKPAVMSAFFNATMAEGSKLRQFVEPWAGDLISYVEDGSISFDIDKLIGRPVFISVAVAKKQDGDEINKVAGCSPVPEGVPKPRDLQGDPVVLDLSAFSLDAFQALPQWLQKLVGRSPEFEALNVDREELPF